MFLADLHIHSRYSRATSGQCVPEYLDLWARRKGIGLVGTGDFTHPAWREELAEKLVSAEEGLYRLRDEFLLSEELPNACAPRFIVTGEISSIYKKNGKVRKVHNLILLPGLEAAQRIARKLEEVGNIHSDGRPILGVDSRDLAEIVLELAPDAVFIPAHIWTPHFSMFGAFSGFDTIEECFEDMTPYIHAVETGLSSDPPMNWRLSALDGYTLVSNSDAHSPSKLGREANLFDTQLSYPDVARALTHKGTPGFCGTIEFFPEEGKYHLDGHRKCALCLEPGETRQKDGVCPVCGGKLTIGVLNRVEQLADRPAGYTPPDAPHFESLIPLPEVIAASTGWSGTGKKTAQLYEQMLHSLGPEFAILRDLPLEVIEREAGPCVAEGIRRMRDGKVSLVPGYDGAYGKVTLLSRDEIDTLSGQLCLFACDTPPKPREQRQDISALPSPEQQEPTQSVPQKEPARAEALNEAQRQAVESDAPCIAVIAGPGTGKTKTLVARIAALVEERGAKPGEITAVTFTNQAAGEMRARLEARLGGKRAVRPMQIGTFHAICLHLLTKERGRVTVVDEETALGFAREAVEQAGCRLSPRRALSLLSGVKNGMQPPEGLPEGLLAAYTQRLREAQALDFDDLLLETLALFRDGSIGCPGFSHLLVDEFQDINPVQYELVKAWGRGADSIFVIGDPDQAIYGFRGADPRCFSRLLAERPDAQRIRLMKNYRSTPEILAASSRVLTRPEQETASGLEAQRPSGCPVRLVDAPDDFSQAVFVAKEIARLVGGIDMLGAAADSAHGRAVGFSDVAVLYRTHRQAEVLEKCLRIEGIPFVVTGRDDTLFDSQVRGALGFFRALNAPGDLVSLRAFLSGVLSVPAALLRDLLACCRTAPACEGPPLSGFPKGYPQRLAGVEPLQRAAALFAAYAPRIAREKPAILLEGWIADCALAVTPALERLLGMAVLHPDMASLLQDLTLGQEADVSRSSSRSYTADCVRLMTLHGAKGLEFPIVFLCGVRRGILPLEMPGRPTQEDEERRLFYVGMTRAREELILLAPGEPSAFLQTIPANLLVRSRSMPAREEAAGRQLSLFE